MACLQTAVTCENVISAILKKIAKKIKLASGLMQNYKRFKKLGLLGYCMPKTVIINSGSSTYKRLNRQHFPRHVYNII